MKKYNQNYSFEAKTDLENKNKEALNLCEESAVTKITCFWILSLIIVYIYPIACAIMYYSTYNDTSGFFTFPFDLIEIYEAYMYRFRVLPNVIILLVRITALIAQHALAIIGKIKYPKNTRTRNIFTIDMTILGVTLGIAIVAAAIFGFLCFVCDSLG